MFLQLSKFNNDTDTHIHERLVLKVSLFPKKTVLTCSSNFDLEPQDSPSG